jgi:hypothetical protein
MTTHEMLATVDLIRHLYVDLGQTMGGPLHVQLDDGNLDDFWVSKEGNLSTYDHLLDGSFERHAQAGDDVSSVRKVAIHDTCEQILRALRLMSVEQRKATVNLFWRHWDGLRWAPNDDLEEAP